MTTHHWGTLINPSHYVEVPPAHVVTADDTTQLRVVGRPAASSTLQVKSAPDLVDRAPITVDGNGYWSYTLDLPDAAVGAIFVSGDNWVTSIGPLKSLEQETAESTAGATAASALAQSTTALSAASAAQSAATIAANAAVSAANSASQNSYPGYVDWTNVRNAPALTGQALTNFTQVIKQSGSSYPTPNAQYGTHHFIGTASPVTQGVMVHGDRWTQVLV